MATETKDNREVGKDVATPEFSFQAWVPSEDTTSDEEDSASSSSSALGSPSRNMGHDDFLMCDEDILECSPPGSKRRRHSLNDQDGSLARARARTFSHAVMLSGKAQRVEAAGWLDLSYPHKLHTASDHQPDLPMCSKA